MLDVFTVAFFGHRYIDDPLTVEERLEKLIQRLLAEKAYVEFLVGRNGEFDQCASSAVVRVRNRYRDDNSALVLVLPYPTAEFIHNEASFRHYYTEVEISAKASVAHPKARIPIRNREMTDRADLIIGYVKEPRGGAWRTVAYARKAGKEIINIAETDRREKPKP